MGSGTSSSNRRSECESSLMKGSEEYIEIKYRCNPCKLTGDEIEAKGYCNDCKEYLCDACLTSHSSSGLSAHHTLLDQTNMPKKSVKGSPQQFLGAYTKKAKVATDNQQRKKEFVFHQTINVKSSSDETDCFIERMTLLSNKELVIIDLNNKSLKIVDTDVKKIRRTLKFLSAPQGMTKISDNRVAVTFPLECKIEIICTSERLSSVQTIKTSGQCLGICYKNGNLYVSFVKKFQILRMTGAVQKTIHPCADALNNCKYTCGLAVSPDEMSIFVTDWKSHKLMRIGLDGTLLCIYQDELDSPRDILISPSGSLYLFVAHFHCLYHVKLDLSEATVLLGPGDGLTAPNSMAFDENRQQLYVSTAIINTEVSNEIKVFEGK